MTISYEWDIEEVDEYGDIIDHDFWDKLKDMNNINKVDGHTHQLVLVRNEGNSEEGLTDREWVYAELKDGLWTLPERFTVACIPVDGCGIKVPKRFHEEIAKWQKS